MRKAETRKDPKYAYAYDEENRLVKISSLTKEERDGHIYKCLSCGCSMIAKLGEKNIHHFAHKVDVECNNESYLHILSKEILRKRFYSSESFNISFYQNSKCDLYNQCPTHQADGSCMKRVLRTIDLKKDYCDCLLEDWDPITNMRPDLKLVRKDPSIKPIWLEIYVNHKCTEEKKNSNRRIIEFKIENEEQAESLSSAEIIESVQLEDYEDFGDEDATIEFTGFEPDTEPIIGFINEYKQKLQATLLTTGYIQLQKLSCRENPRIFDADGVAAVIFSEWRGNVLYKAQEAFAKNGIGNFKSCYWCKNHLISCYGNRYCYYNKHLGIVGPPEMKHAYFCDWCYKPVFSEELPSIVLNERYTLDQARVLMQNHPPTPTDRPVYYSPYKEIAPQPQPTVEVKKSDLAIPYRDDTLLPIMSDVSGCSQGTIQNAQRFATAIYNHIRKDDRTADWAIRNESAFVQDEWPVLQIETNIGKYRIVCRDPWNERIFEGYKIIDDYCSNQIFTTGNHDCIVDLILKDADQNLKQN